MLPSSQESIYCNVANAHQSLIQAYVLQINAGACIQVAQPACCSHEQGCMHLGAFEREKVQSVWLCTASGQLKRGCSHHLQCSQHACALQGRGACPVFGAARQAGSLKI